MKIYLDTNILSNLVGGIDRLTNETGLALEKLSKSNNKFITSPLMKQEMERASNQKVRGAILFMYKIFGEKKKSNSETYIATGLDDALLGTVLLGGGIIENTDLSLLKQVFTPIDAQHIFQALSNHVDYFLTLDKESILERYHRNKMNIQDFCRNKKMEIVSPIELVKKLGL